MNPFNVLDAVRADYRTYVQTFQRFQNPCHPPLGHGAH